MNWYTLRTYFLSIVNLNSPDTNPVCSQMTRVNLRAEDSFNEPLKKTICPMNSHKSDVRGILRAIQNDQHIMMEFGTVCYIWYSWKSLILQKLQVSPWNRFYCLVCCNETNPMKLLESVPRKATKLCKFLPLSVRRELLGICFLSNVSILSL